MKRISRNFGMLVLAVVFAGMPLLFTATQAMAQEDIANHPSCPFCGMDREKFAHSRVLVTYDDGSEFGACSLHCAAIDMAQEMDKAPQSIMVGDYTTKKLIDAEKAHWVLNGKQTGVMTKRAKWAFQSKADAEQYIQKNGGESVSFENALKATFEDMYEDSKMIREKRKEMRMKKMKHQDQG